MSSSVQHPVDAEELVDPAPMPIRRSFTTEYRHRVVAEYEAVYQQVVEARRVVR